MAAEMTKAELNAALSKASPDVKARNPDLKIVGASDRPKTTRRRTPEKMRIDRANAAAAEARAKITTHRAEKLMTPPKPKPPPTRTERVRGHIQRVAAATPRPIRQHAIRHGTTIAGWFAGLTALGIAYAVLMNPNLIVVPLKLLSAAVGAILTMVRSVVSVPTGKTGSAAGVLPGWGA